MGRFGCAWHTRLPRDAALACGIAVCTLLMLSAVAEANGRGDAGSVRTDLSNGVITQSLSVSPDLPLASVTGSRCGGERGDWVERVQAGEYRIRIRDSQTGTVREITSLDPHAEVAHEQRADAVGGALEITMRREDVPVEVTLRYETFGRHPFIRREGLISNLGTTPLLFSSVDIEAFRLLPHPDGLRSRYGLERLPSDQRPPWFALHETDLSEGGGISFDTGRWKSAAWIVFERKCAGENLVLGWETSAPTTCTVDGGCALTVRMPMDYWLEPGQSVAIPASFLGVVAGDADDASYATQRFVEQHVARPNPGDDFPYVMFNTWGYGTAVDDALARQAIDICAALGVEALVVDFGWEDPDWQPRADRFPHGLAPLSDLAHTRCMKFGIHLSFANVSEKARMYAEHPDWAYGDGCFAYGFGESSVYGLSLGLPEVREWAVNKVIEVLDREKADWFLTDTHLWGYINPERHDVKGDQEYLAATGHELTLDAIRRQRPHVLIEHCDGGLSLANYRMMRQHVTSITCDNADALETRMSVYDLSGFLPPRYLDKYQQEWRSHYANRSCMLGGPWILMMPIHTLQPGSRDWRELAEDIAVYKRFRSRIRDGKVLHLLRPGAPADASWDGWDAIGSYHPREDAAVVFVFRTRGGMRTRTVPMKGLQPDHTYRVRYLDGGQSYTASGREILCGGFALALDAYDDDPNGHCSEIVTVEPVASP